MSAAREQMLGAIREALGREELSEDAQGTLTARLDRPQRHTLPAIDGDLAERFLNRLAAVAGTWSRASDLDAVPAEIESYFDAHQLERSVVIAPALEALAWPGDWQVNFGATQGHDQTGITPCFVAVAETGSVVLLSGAQSPTTLNFLPENHLVLVRRTQIVRHVEDVWTRLRQGPEAMPRSCNFITGPSRTADIEQTIQLGAHGPRRLHVILVE